MPGEDLVINTATEKGHLRFEADVLPCLQAAMSAKTNSKMIGRYLIDIVFPDGLRS